MENKTDFTREQIASGIMTYMHALEIQDETTLINTFKIVGRDYIKSILGQLVTEGRLEHRNNIYMYVARKK